MGVRKPKSKEGKLTVKERKFVKEYALTGNGTQAALNVYDTDSYMTAANIASENLNKPKIQALLEKQAEYALLDQIEIREELKESKKDYAVRAGVNRDILDRNGVGVKLGGDTNIQMNFNLTNEQLDRIAKETIRNLDSDVAKESDEFLPAY